MKSIMKYSGLAVLSISLIMLSLGSMPQTYAGTSGSVDSTMTLTLTCGLTVLGTVDWGTGVILGTILDSQVSPNLAASSATIENTGVGLATVEANTGDDTLPSGGGGYSEANNDVHILNAQIEVDIGPGYVTMAPVGVDVTIGTVAQSTTVDLDMRVDLNFVQGLPTTDNTWTTTVTISQLNCELV